MMGHRGCRLPVTYPEIAEMQARAIIEAAIRVNAECGYHIVPEIMIPLVGEVKELRYVKNIVRTVADKVIAEQGAELLEGVGLQVVECGIHGVGKASQKFIRVGRVSRPLSCDSCSTRAACRRLHRSGSASGWLRASVM